MDIFESLLQNLGIKDYDQLTPDEQTTYRSWLEKVEKAKITLEDVKKGVSSIREALEMELVNEKQCSPKDLFLKARLKNIIIIESILSRPDRAKAALEGYVSQTKAR
jgi:hypothetical protein